MTREEAIKIIQNEYKCVNRECDIERSCGKCPYMIPTKEPILQAYDMAIQVLSQEPTEKPITVDEMEREYEKSKALFHKIVECDDAISREAVLKGIEELKKSPWATANRSHGYEYLITEALDVVKDLCVKQLPSVTQKSGKWVEIDDEPHEVWECDHCGFVIDGSGCIEPYEYRDTYKFCPNCGAKMVEPQESEE